MAVLRIIGDLPIYIGVSGDTKPDGSPEAKTFYETDTKVTYIYDTTGTWVVMAAAGTSDILAAIVAITDSQEDFFFEATGSAAIASTLALNPVSKFQIKEVRLHLDAVGGAVGDVNFDVNIDALAAAAYDVNLFNEDMTAVADILWQPEKPIVLKSGDEIDVVYANGSSALYGLVIVYNKLA